MTPGEYRIEVEIPPGRRRRAQVVARDLTGRIITTCCADLMDAAGPPATCAGGWGATRPSWSACWSSAGPRP
jgi:hypothetical protein